MSIFRTQLNRFQKTAIFGGVVAVALSGIAAATQVQQQQLQPFPPPKNEPVAVTPGPKPGDPPSDAVILFDGKNLSGWESARPGGGDAKWEVKDGYIQVMPKTGDIQTREKFGDVQLHIEWATPEVVKGEGQGRGNSGIFLMNHYELQVLDSFNNKTYFHGQAGSIYKQYAPLVNVSRKPGEWQAYDVVFTAPRFDEQGKALQRARFTVFQNGVLVQNNVEVFGDTYNDKPAVYTHHGNQEPLKLQDHGDLIRYRNIWIRKL
jgi:hypothetical protein